LHSPRFQVLSDRRGGCAQDRALVVAGVRAALSARSASWNNIPKFLDAADALA
jgi:hypothetical protein